MLLRRTSAWIPRPCPISRTSRRPQKLQGSVSLAILTPSYRKCHACDYDQLVQAVNSLSYGAEQNTTLENSGLS